MASQHEIIGEEWRSRAGELADWAMQRLANRKDVWGQYSPLTPQERRTSDRSYKAMTLPVKDKRGADMVTLDKLTRHFGSRRLFRPQLIGLHAKSKEGTSKWLGIDIDCHDVDGSVAEDHARRNLDGALAWWREFQQRGYDPLLFDSSNRGGYHLWILLENPAPTEDVFALGQDVIGNWQALNLDEEPETFPKQPKPDKPESLGSWFRLPGLHHTYDHYATVWGGDDWLGDPWLAGHAAIDMMLQVVPGPPPPSVGHLASHKRVIRERAAKHQNTDAPAPTATTRKQRFKRTGKASVCIDLDGVLAKRSSSGIGAPIDGALEFTREIAEYAHIIVFTARFSAKRLQQSSEAREQLRQQIETWLEQHHFSYDEICTDTAKPLAQAYVDDRAVSCRPESDGLLAYQQAQLAVTRLCDE